MADSPHYDVHGEMQLLAQTAVIAVFARLMRIRIATQDGAQRQMTLALLQNEFDEALRTHESQTLVDSVLSERGTLFRSSFTELSAQLMREVALGLTDDEKASILG